MDGLLQPEVDRCFQNILQLVGFLGVLVLFWLFCFWLVFFIFNGDLQLGCKNSSVV